MAWRAILPRPGSKQCRCGHAGADSRSNVDAGRGAAPAAPYAAACADTSSDANTDGTDRCGPQPKVSRPSWAPLVRGDVTTQIGCPPVKPAPYLPFALSTSIVSPLLAER